MTPRGEVGAVGQVDLQPKIAVFDSSLADVLDGHQQAILEALIDGVGDGQVGQGLAVAPPGPCWCAIIFLRNFVAGIEQHACTQRWVRTGHEIGIFQYRPISRLENELGPGIPADPGAIRPGDGDVEVFPGPRRRADVADVNL